ncbi:MAG: hypothetical protein II614_05875 [Ruminococcus sp.]|nr:hypothetical protein [Ruminococcus sp.]
MRIELLKQSFCNLTDLQETYKRVGLTVMKADTEKVIDSFKAVKSKIYNMDGGAGNLQTAVEQLDERINKVDSQRVEKVDLAMQNLGAFLHTVRMADQRAAQTISASNALFYEANPWAIPPPPPKKKSVWQRIKDAFKKAGKAIAGAFKKAVDWVVDCAKKAWTATKNFIVKHWKTILKIVVGIVIIAGLAALSVFTGGAAAPLFLVAAKGAAIAAATGAAVTVVSGVVQGKSAGEIFDSCGDSILMGAVTGAVGGFAGAAAGAVTSATGSQLLGELTKIGVEMGGKIIATGTNYLIDNNGSLDGYWDAHGKDILISGASAAGSAVGGELVSVGKDMLGDAMGGLTDNQFTDALKNGYNWCKEQMPTLTNMATNAAKDTFGSLSWGDLSKLSNPADFAKSLGSSLVNNVANQAMGAMGDFVTNDFNNITGGAVSDVIDGIKGSGFGQAVSNIAGEVSGAINDISGAINGAIGDIGGAINGAIGDIGGAINGAIGDIGSNINGAIGDVGGAIGNAIGSAGGSLGNITNQISGVIGGIGDYFSGVGSAFGGAVGDVIGGVTSSVGDIGGMINNAVGSAVSGAVSSTMPKLPTGLNPAGIRGDLGLAFDSLAQSGQTITTVIMPDFSGVARPGGSVAVIGQAASASGASLGRASGVSMSSWMASHRL